MTFLALTLVVCAISQHCWFVGPATGTQVEQPHKAEIVTSLKGTVIRCAEESADMYKSIDEVCDRLVSLSSNFRIDPCNMKSAHL